MQRRIPRYNIYTVVSFVRVKFSLCCMVLTTIVFLIYVWMSEVGNTADTPNPPGLLSF